MSKLLRGHFDTDKINLLIKHVESLCKLLGRLKKIRLRLGGYKK